MSLSKNDPLQMMRQVAESEFRDDSSQGDDSSSHDGNPVEEEPKLKEAREFSAKEAARSTNCVGYVVLCLLVLLGSLLSILTHFYVQGSEEQEFEQGFNITAIDFVAAMDRNANHVHTSLENLARLFSSHADISDEVVPLLTLHDFEAFAISAREDIGAKVVAYAPYILNEETRSEWEAYTVTEQSWIESSYAYHPDYDPSGIEAVSPRIWRNDASGSPVGDPGPGPYAPLWQISPPPVDTSVINFNLASSEEVDDWIVLQHDQNTSWSFLSQPVDMTSVFGSGNYQEDEMSEPTSLAWLPVMRSLLSVQHDDELAGAIVADVRWSTLMRDSLPALEGAVFAVVDSCGFQHTYKVEPSGATFLGEGDLHDRSYTGMGFQKDLGVFFSGTVNVTDFCRHEISVYPSSANEDQYGDDSPYVYALGAAICFFFAILLFLFYDMYVRFQQNRVVGHAERSQALVSSLFPNQVAKRLFERNDPSRGSFLDNSNHSSHLLNFVTKSERRAASAPNMDERPIAELFPEATVMFADIAGFTAWSSIREPTQVFQLLESIFQAFDEEARKAGVFKVETVGDCYVAVCGVPEACTDHAQIMAKFARECLFQFNKVVRGLELVLGPDTGDLAMRIGLNSGPVTAGVLRGERARFQLFGDTVNTASRIETTGQRDRVHVSEQTAKFLKSAGHGDWVVPREDAVQAKGKGLINTYWLIIDDGDRLDASEGAYVEDDELLHADEEGMFEDSNDGSTHGSDSKDKSHHRSVLKGMMDPATARKVERLVAWNTELLLQLLKAVVAKRSAVSSRRFQSAALTAMAQNIASDGMVVEEVTEIIELPDFDDRLSSNKIDINTVQLSGEVIAQTRRYVSLIASMYRDNPFHNFEHASHVTMSVSKLLSRIVAPHVNKEELSTAKQQEELFLHDHTYGITSDPITQFSVVLSALIHDVDHRGVPNFVLQEEDKYLAKVYKNKSIAEQNSVDLAWNTLMEPEFEALRSTIFTDIGELKRFRQLLVNSVIATDIFDKELSALRKKRWTKAFSVAKEERTTKDVHRMATIVIEHLIQASDVAHTMQHWHVYRKWNERLFAEMYQAYKTGRTDKDPTGGWYKGELWFFDNYIIPLAKKLKECGVFGVSSDEYLTYAMENRQEWEAKGETVVASLVETYGA